MATVEPRSKRDADSTTPVRTTFLRRGDASPVHRHAEHATWVHVVSGTIVDERWTRDAEGGFVHERRVLEHGQSMAAPGDSLHRVHALGDAAFVTTCACGCVQADAIHPRELAVVRRLSRSGVDREWATATALGEPTPD
jgi:hypothetical protein